MLVPEVCRTGPGSPSSQNGARLAPTERGALMRPTLSMDEFAHLELDSVSGWEPARCGDVGRGGEPWSHLKQHSSALGSMNITRRRQTGGWRSAGAAEHGRTALWGLTTSPEKDAWFVRSNGWTPSRERDTSIRPKSRSTGRPTSGTGRPWTCCSALRGPGGAMVPDSERRRSVDRCLISVQRMRPPSMSETIHRTS